MARLEQITYGSYTVGLSATSASVTLEDRYGWDIDDTSTRLSFRVLIAAATPEAFGDARAAFVAAMQAPDEALTVVVDSQTEHTYDPSANTGLNTRGSVRKIPGKHNTAKSGRFEVTIACGLPMTATGRNGRRSGRVQVFKTNSGRRRAVIEATYTAATAAMTGGSARGARAQFEHADGMATFASAQITALGGTWELLAETPVTTDQNDKVASGVRVYQEIKYNQGVGSLDVAAVRDQNLVISRTDPSIADTVDAIGGGTWSVRKLQLLTANYRAAIDFDTSTDLKGLWTGTILPRIDESVASFADSTVIRSTPEAQFDPVENVISARVTYLADVGGSFQRMRESLAEEVSTGVILEPVWNGDPLARIEDQGPINHTRTLTRQYTERLRGTPGEGLVAGGGGGGGLGIFGIGAGLGIGGLGAGIFGIGTSLGFGFSGPGGGGGGAAGGAGGGGQSGDASKPPDQGDGWALIRTRKRESPIRIGPFSNGLALNNWVRSWVWIRRNLVTGRPRTGSDPRGAGQTRERPGPGA